MHGLERLLHVLLLLLVSGGALFWLRLRQRGALARRGRELAAAMPTLIAVVSRNCAVCPAQKRILEQLGACYPASTLRIETIDLEVDPQRVRELQVMTVPTTLLIAANGTICHINNGLAGFEKIKFQIKEYFQL